MVKVVSKVSMKLSSRNVLFAPGGKGELHKHVRGKESPATDRQALKWVKVNAPAYISGSLRL